MIEEIFADDCPLLEEENQALSTRSKDFERSEVRRLTFWRCLPDQVQSADDFIGYAIFKTDHFSTSRQEDHIYESVFPIVRTTNDNNFVHCIRTYSVNTITGFQSVKGVLYAQQNDQTYVCAHVALRTALSSVLPDGDISYEEMNRLAGIDHENRCVGKNEGGLSPDDMETIFLGLGLEYEKIVHEPDLGHMLPNEFQRDLYGIIESGWPALLGFELKDPTAPPGKVPRHIVPVIGHTFNDDAWVPDAQRAYFGNQLAYYSSESWLSSYVLHDDNFGPYYCLPRHFLDKENFRMILGLKPKTISFPASDAEVVGFNFLNAILRGRKGNGTPWHDRFLIFTHNGLLVLRTLVLEKSDYLDHLRAMTDWEGNQIESNAIAQIAAILPKHIWMIEASAQELFASSRRKFGEVLLPAEQPLPRPLNTSILLGIRLPGSILMSSNGSLNTLEVSLKGHSPLYQQSTN